MIEAAKSAAKIFLWLAPVMALLFFYITQQQQGQTYDMKEVDSKFDENFAAMNKGLSSGDEKQYWSDAQSEAHDRHEKAKEKAAESNKKQEDTFAAMEKELANTDAEALIQSQK